MPTPKIHTRESVCAAVDKAIAAHPEVFPSITGLSKLRGVPGTHALAKNLPSGYLTPSQLAWVRDSDETHFMEALVKVKVQDPSEEVKSKISERLEAIIKEELRRHAEVFPNMLGLINLTGTPGVGVLKSYLSKKSLEKLQIEWIQNSNEDHFMDSLSKGSFIEPSKKVKSEISKRLEPIVREEIRKHPETFPSLSAIIGLPKMPDYGALVKYLSKKSLEKLQIEWIQNSNKDYFIPALVEKRIKDPSEKVKSKISERLEAIIKEELRRHPEVFPAFNKLCALPGMPGIGVLKNYLSKKSLERLQIEWIENSEVIHFTDSLSKGVIVEPSKEVESKVSERLERISRSKLQERSEVFPSFGAISELPEMPGVVVLRKHLSEEQLEKLQIEWIESSDRTHFMSLFRYRKVSYKLSREVISKINERLRSIVEEELERSAINSLNALTALIGTTNQTLQRRVPDVQAMIAVSHVLRGTRSPDQKIVAKIGLRVVERLDNDPWLHDLFKERLNQLWLFREVCALAQAGYGRASVVSFSHHLLPAKVKELLPETDLHFQYLDWAMDGTLYLKHLDRVVLPSVLQFTGERLAAQILTGVAKATLPGTEVVFTFTHDHHLTPTAAEELRKLGYELEKTGELTLTPPSGMPRDEREKIFQRSKVAVLRRIELDGPSVDSIDLFLKDQQQKPTTSGRKSTTVTYDPADLKRANPSVVLHGAQASLVSAPIPQIIAIDAHDDPADGFILTLRSGEVVGFDVNPNKPNTVEIEGNPINDALIGESAAILRGEQGGSRAEDRIKHNDQDAPGPERYAELLGKLEARRPDIAETAVRRVKPKRRVRSRR